DNHCFYAGFQQGASVRKLSTVYYFVAPSLSGNTFSLYRQKGHGAPAEELLEGVEDMQLEFGVDEDGDSIVDEWYAADDADFEAEMWSGWDWNTLANEKDPLLVRAVRYSLLLVTEDAVLGEDQTLSYNGASLVKTDRRLRQVFSSSVGIRSRINP